MEHFALLKWHGNTFEVSDLIQSPPDNSTNLVTLSFQYLFHQKFFLFFHVENNGILVEYAYSFLD